MASTDGEEGSSGGAGEIEVFEGLELCVSHAEVCGGWEGEGGRASAPEVMGVELRRALEEA